MQSADNAANANSEQQRLQAALNERNNRFTFFIDDA